MNVAGPWGDDKMGLTGNAGGPWPNSEWGPGPKSKNAWGDCGNNDMDQSSWGQKNIVCVLMLYFSFSLNTFLYLKLFRDKRIKIKTIYGKVNHTEFLLKWESRYIVILIY